MTDKSEHINGMLFSPRDGDKSLIKDNSMHQTERQRVASQARLLFRKLDEQVAKRIGVPGIDILKTIYENRPMRFGETINTAKLPNKLTEHIRQTQFLYQLKDLDENPILTYKIDCYGTSFNPEFDFETNEGSVSFRISPKMKRDDFSSVSVSRSIHNPSDGFLGEKTVSTFVTNEVHGEPDYPLEIDLRAKTQRSMSMCYGRPDDQGDVTLVDGQRIIIVTKGPFNITGIYSKANQNIEWGSSNNSHPKVIYDTKGNKLQVKLINGEEFIFPITTNIYKEIKEILGNTGNLFNTAMPPELGTSV